MRKLRCRDEECDSRTDDQPPMFDVHLTVDEDGDTTEQARHIDGEYFTCCFCADSAEWVDTETGEVVQ